MICGCNNFCGLPLCGWEGLLCLLLWLLFCGWRSKLSFEFSITDTFRVCGKIIFANRLQTAHFDISLLKGVS